MTAEGIKFETEVEVGKDLSCKELVDQYDAVCLCLGSTWPRDLPIPGTHCTHKGLFTYSHCDCKSDVAKMGS